MGIISYRGKKYSYKDAVGIETVAVKDIEEIRLLPATEGDLMILDEIFNGDFTPTPRPPESFLTDRDLQNLGRDLNRLATLSMALNQVVTDAKWYEDTNLGDDRPLISIKHFSRGKQLDTITWTYFDRYGRVVSQTIKDTGELFAAMQILLEHNGAYPGSDKPILVRNSDRKLLNEPYKKLMLAKKIANADAPRLRLRNRFIEEHKNIKILNIKLKNGVSSYYTEHFADFGVVERYEELKRELEKNRNADNPGEANVEYTLKWTLATNPDMFIPVVGNCESKYRLNCILLQNPSFINEPQEFDHLLVTRAGIISIETKHWKDRVEIRQDGKWVRHTNDESHGVESPKMQIQRHETLLKSILPGVPIFSILCFSHASIVIDGKENFKACPITTTENLGDAIQSICSATTYSTEEMRRIIAVIEAHKTSTVTDKVDSTKRYWEEHADEKNQYENRLIEIENQIESLVEEFWPCFAKISEISHSEPPQPPASAQLDELHRRISQLEAEIDAAGLLAIRRKKAIQSQIESLRHQIPELSALVSHQRTAIADELAKQLADLENREQSLDEAIFSLEREKNSILAELRKKH